MIPGDIQRLLEAIGVAENEADINALLERYDDAIAELPERERERVNEQIADAVREWREAQ
jgi:hypothetical protein